VFCISIERPEVRKGQLLRLFRFEDWVIWPVNSDLKGDQTSHAFLWQRGLLRDIGTLGGDFAMSQWLDEDGGVDGASTTAEGAFHAFYWQGGKMHDLGSLNSNSRWQCARRAKTT
jgi:probable HAF family extracellular repeat protein